MNETMLSPLQQTSLIVLRTLVGWHFLYEGFFKLWSPAWSQSGEPLARWTSAGYLRAASGPFSGFFHGMAQSPWLGTLDVVVAVSLLLVGLSLMLGLFTRAGCAGGLLLLILFYVASIPTHGLPQPGAEGAYLLVNKTLVEAAAMLALLAFDTGRIAGLDRLRAGTQPPLERAVEASS